MFIQVAIIDFGSSALLQNTDLMSFTEVDNYSKPDYRTTTEYYSKPIDNLPLESEVQKKRYSSC